MNKVVFICPYFGKLPINQINLFLKCCSYNEKFNFLIITDDKTKFHYPKNVKFVYYSFEELKKMMQLKFDFKLNIQTPYKLCDFKPAYGYIFCDFIKEYEYWGYCDMSDMIFGDLSKFIDFNLINKYDKINYLGHLTLYKNTSKVNKRIFERCNDKYELKNIFGNQENMAFDENMEYGINRIYSEKGYSSLRIDNMYSDIAPKYFVFREAKCDVNYNFYYPKNRFIYRWNKGKLYKVGLKNNMINEEEIGYCHYQKRKMNFENFDFNIDEFLIVPNSFINYSGDVKKDVFKKYTRNKLYLQFFNLTYKNIVKRIKNKLK